MKLGTEVERQLITKAKRSTCRIRMSAIALDKNGKVLAFASNQSRFKKENGSVHAEMVALQKGGKKTKTIVICRVGRGGNLLPISSCETCQRILDKKGISVKTIS